MSAPVALLLAALSLGLGVAYADALHIDGLRPSQPLRARAVQPQLEQQQLTLAFSDNEIVRIQPWPSYLPQRFGPQRASGELRLLPAGPLSRLELTRAEEAQPWLVMAHGSRPHDALYGGWRLLLEQGNWWAQQGERRVPLNTAPGKAPPRLKVEGATWCFYRLDARLSASPTAAQTREQEPQLDWVMQRQESCRRPCSRLTPTSGAMPE